MKFLEKLFGAGGQKGPSMEEMFVSEEGKPSVIILSSSCCNPLAGPGDEKLNNNITEALANLGMETEIHLLSITKAQAQMGSLPEQHKDLGSKVMGLFQSKGIAAFPALLINGELIFYGGIPETEQIQEKLAAFK